MNSADLSSHLPDPLPLSSLGGATPFEHKEREDEKIEKEALLPPAGSSGTPAASEIKEKSGNIPKHIQEIKTKNAQAWSKFVNDHPFFAALIALIYKFAVKLLFLPALSLNKQELAKAREDFFASRTPSAKEKEEANAKARDAIAALEDAEDLKKDITKPTPLVASTVEAINKRFSITLSPSDLNRLHVARMDAKIIESLPPTVKRKMGYSSTIHPALSMLRDIIAEHHLEALSKKIQAEARLKITTADGVKLDCCQLLADPPGKKWVIRLNGNKEGYEDTLVHLDRDLRIPFGVNVLTGNPRGVGESEGFPTGSHDLVLDAEAMYQHLIGRGIKPEDIIISGYSLGGGRAAQLAVMHPESHLWLERTFSSHSEAANELVTSYVHSRLIGNIAQQATKGGWELDTLTALESLNPKRYTIVEHSKDEIIFGHARLGARVKAAYDSRPVAEKDEPMPLILISDEAVKGVTSYHMYPLSSIISAKEAQQVTHRMNAVFERAVHPKSEP